MRKELSPGAALALALAALVLLIGGMVLVNNRQRQQQTEEIEKIIQRGVGRPPASPTAPR